MRKRTSPRLRRGEHMVFRKDLKPEKELSDEELLADALRQAIEYRNRNKENGNQ